MKAFLAACVAIAVIGYGAHYVLDRSGFTSAERTARDSTVRLD